MRRDKENILNTFASYTVHYYVLVTNSHQVAVELTKGTKDSKTQDLVFEKIKDVRNTIVQNTDFTDHYGDNIRVQKRSPVIVKNSNQKLGKAVFLIDSRTDADFIVERFKVQTIIGDESAKAGGFSNAFTIEAELNIYEPYSASLVQLLQEVTFLDSDPDSASNDEPKFPFFVIQPFIVPSNIKNDKKVDHISALPEIYPFAPNVFMMLNFGANCDTSGTSYTFSLVNDTDGMGHLPLFSTIVQNTNLRLAPYSNLYDALIKMQDAFNATSDSMRAKQNSSKDINSNKATTKIFYPKFKFKIDESYKDGKYNFTTNSFSNMNTDTGSGDVILPFKDGDVSRAITYLTSLNRQVMEDMKPDFSNPIIDSDGKKYYKSNQLIVTTEYDSKGSADLSSVVITVNVKRREQLFAEDTNNVSNVPLMEEKLKTKIVEYDYIYTGKNINVLDFKMSVVNGFAFTNTKSGYNLMPGAQNNDKGSSHVGNDNPMCASNITSGAKNKKQSVWLTQDIGSQIKYYDLINKVSFIESMAFEMQVVGDTIWYNDFSINPTRLPDGPYKDWRTAPALLKLNIKYPISPNFWEPRDPDYNSDFRNRFLSIAEQENDPRKLQDFWYQGLIRILMIETVFENGTFSHTIQGFPLISASQQLERVKEDTGHDQNKESQKTTDAVAAYNKRIIDPDNDDRNKNHLPSSAINIKNDTFRPPIFQAMPIKGNIIITSTFGEPRKGGQIPYHTGVDIHAPAGTPIYAIWDGMINGYMHRTAKEAMDIITIYNPTLNITYRCIHIKIDKKWQKLIQQSATRDAKGRLQISRLNIPIQAGELIGVTAPITQPHLHLDMFNLKTTDPLAVEGYWFNPLAAMPPGSWSFDTNQVSTQNAMNLRLPRLKK